MKLLIKLFFLISIYSQVLHFSTLAQFIFEQTETSIKITCDSSSITGVYNVEIDNSVDSDGECSTVWVKGSLNSGQLYSFSITYGTNLSFSKDVATKPSKPSNIVLDSSSTNELSVSWIPPSSGADSYDLEFTTGGLVKKNSNSNTNYFTQSNLNSGTTYTVSIKSVKNSLHSVPEQKSFSTKPDKPSNIVLDSFLTNELSISWTAPTSEADSYEVMITSDAYNEVFTSTDTSITRSDLVPGTLYTIKIKSVKHGEKSDPEEQQFSTQPDKPSNIVLGEASTNGLSISWTEPPFVVDNYEVTITSDTYNNVITTEEKTIVRSDLVSGTQYTISVKSSKYGKKSDAAEMIFATKPEPPANLQITQRTSNSMFVQWGRSPTPDVEYRLECDPVPNINTSDLSKRIVGLSSATDYTISIRSVKHKLDSASIEITYSTNPDKPKDLEIDKSTPESLSIEWSPPSGDEIKYNYQLNGNNMNYAKTDQSETTFIQNELSAGIRYDFELEAVRKGHSSGLITGIFWTRPKKPQNLRVTQQDDLTKIKLQWEAAEDSVQSSYKYCFKTIICEDNEYQSTTLLEAELSLTTGDKYHIQLKSFNDDSTANGYDSATSSIYATIPFKPDVDKSSFSDYINLTISSRNGNDVTYLIVYNRNGIEENMTAIGNKVVNVHGLEPHQNYTFHVRAILNEFISETVTISAETVESTPGPVKNITHQFLDGTVLLNWSEPTEKNGIILGYNVYYNNEGNKHTKKLVQTDAVLKGMKNGQSYDIYVSARTVKGEGPEVSHTITIPKGGLDLRGEHIVLIVTSLLLVIFAIASIILIRQGACISMGQYHNVFTMKSLSKSKPSFRNPIDLNIQSFEDHCKKMAADTDLLYAEEFESLRDLKKEHSWETSELPSNRAKNRFINILPFDHSRVKLLSTDDEEGSDYINASYVPGYNSKREFIAAQGPLAATRDDFWRMIWEQRVRAIVMLTKCVEKGKEKCDHYWPVDYEPMFYGDLKVETLNETKNYDWVITEFRISMGEQELKVTHYHYIAWPDFGTPESPKCVSRFVQLIRTKYPPMGGPIIVHCSAGVGRSGTFIALDTIYQAIMNADEKTDILNMVFTMRQHRYNMVQTEAQYILIHNSALCFFKLDDTDDLSEGVQNDTFVEGVQNDTFVEGNIPEDEGIEK